MAFCALDNNCTVYDSHARIPGYTFGAPICEGCKYRAVSELHQLRLDYVDLSFMLGRTQTVGGVQIHRPKPESSPPISLGVFTLRGEIAYVVRLGADALRRHLGSSVPKGLPVREGFGLDADVRYLVPHVEDVADMAPVSACWVMDEPEAVALTGVQILGLFSVLNGRARRVLGLRSKTISVPGHCPGCGLALLRRTDDNADLIWCHNCHHKMDRDAYHRHAKDLFSASGSPPPGVPECA